MEELYENFLKYLLDEDKENCVKLALSSLEGGKADIPVLYTEILAGTLNSIRAHNSEKHLSIWQEHVRSGIIRTVIECCYPYIMKQVNNKYGSNRKGKVAVICPDGELHELGARMAADFFVLEGYSVYFVGSSTPKAEFLAVIDHVKPDYIAISVTNFYNIVAAKRAIQEIKSKSLRKVKLLAGGSAFKGKEHLVGEIGADMHINSYIDIQNLKKGENEA